jgi:hypothetical protein
MTGTDDEQKTLVKRQVWMCVARIWIGSKEDFDFWFDHMYKDRKELLDKLAEDD